MRSSRCSVWTAQHVFREAKRVGLFEKGWAWLVSEEALKVEKKYLPYGKTFGSFAHHCTLVRAIIA